jgi:hypothetical protein
MRQSLSDPAVLGSIATAPNLVIRANALGNATA